MCEMIRKVKEESERLGLFINNAKTKIMVIDRDKKLDDLNLLRDYDIVNQFIYLGSLINDNGSCEEEIRRRIQIARAQMVKLKKIWLDKNIKRTTKTQLVRTLIFSIALYGAETWTLKATDRRRIDAFEMWTWRRMMHIPWTAHRTNMSVREEVKVLTPLSITCDQKILSYFGHTMRREPDSLEKTLIIGKIEGARKRGRSPRRWVDQVVELTGSRLTDAVRSAQNRSRWRAAVRNHKVTIISND